jgi:hypothetical protein
MIRHDQPHRADQQLVEVLERNGAVNSPIASQVPFLLPRSSTVAPRATRQCARGAARRREIDADRAASASRPMMFLRPPAEGISWFRQTIQHVRLGSWAAGAPVISAQNA